jgi:hypothetical protein
VNPENGEKTKRLKMEDDGGTMIIHDELMDRFEMMRDAQEKDDIQIHSRACK